MCTHCCQPIRILLARQPANHKLITICWNLEWGTSANFNMRSSSVYGRQCKLVRLTCSPPSSELRTPDWYIPVSRNINFHSKPINSLPLHSRVAISRWSILKMMTILVLPASSGISIIGCSDQYFHAGACIGGWSEGFWTPPPPPWAADFQKITGKLRTPLPCFCIAIVATLL